GVAETAVVEYGSSSSGPMADTWRRSVFYQLWTTGTDELRRRFWRGEPADFVNLDTLRDEGATDFIAFVRRFAHEGVIGELDAVYLQWATREPEGFADDHVAALRRLVPVLALAIKCASLARIAGTLVEVYLGRDAGQRVLRGRIARGVAERISAVLWFSDLRGYTTITDTAAPDDIIPLLNDYPGAGTGAIHGARGGGLKV